MELPARLGGRLARIAAVLGVLCLSACGGSGDHPGATDADGGKPVGGFNPPSELLLGDFAVDMHIYDLDGDGKRDILLPKLGGGIAVCSNESTSGSIVFSQSSVLDGTEQTVGLSVSGAEVGGKPRLGVLTNTGQILIYALTGGAYELTLGIEDVLCGGIVFDLVNSDDEDYDLLVADERFRSLTVFFFDSDGNRFPGPGPYEVDTSFDQPYESRFVQMYTSDLDGNGLSDIALVDQASCSLQVYLHLPGNYFPVVVWDETLEEYVPIEPGARFPLINSRYGVSEIDLLVVVPNSGKAGNEPTRVASGDLNNSGVEDFVVVSQIPGGADADDPLIVQDPQSQALSCWISVYQSSLIGAQPPSDGYRELEMTDVAHLYFPGAIHDVAVADLNLDGINDIVGVSEKPMSSGSSHLFYFPGLGDFEYDDPIAYVVAGRPLRLSCLDYDGDGFPDVVTLSPDTNTPTIHHHAGPGELDGNAIVVPFGD